MEELKTDVQPSETAEEKETPKNDENQTTEDGASGEGTGDGGKKEDSPFQKQLEELKAREEAALKAKEEAEAKLEKEKEIVEHKNRALEAEKKKNALSAEELKKELLEDAKKLLMEEKLETKLNDYTSDPVEREVIKKHYQNSIKQTGDLNKDLLAAIGIANAEQVITQRRNQALEENNENFLSSFPSSSAHGETKSQFKSQVEVEAEKLVRLINPKAVEHLKKQFRR